MIKKNVATTAMIVGSLLIIVGLGMTVRDWQISSSAASGEPLVLAVTATRTLVPTFTPAVPETPSPEAPKLLPAFQGAESPEKPSASEGYETTPLPASATPAVATPTPAAILAADAPPDRLVIPSIQLDATVVPMGWRVRKVDGKEVSEWVVPENAVGWHKNSALPGHGENVVMSGHHNIKGEVFRHLVDVKVGDRIALYVGSTLYPYEVAETYILKEKGQPISVRLKNARFMRPTGDDRLTLISCWPYTNNTHRVVVVAKPRDWTARSQIRGTNE